MQVNKNQYGRAIKVINSDTVNIPSPSGLGMTGTAGETLANSLSVDDPLFSSNLVGAIVINNTDGTIANVIGFENDKVLLLDADIFAIGELFSIYNSENNQGCALYIPKQTPAMLTVMTVGGDIVSLALCGDANASMILPLNVTKVYSTDTTLTDLVALW